MDNELAHVLDVFDPASGIVFGVAYGSGAISQAGYLAQVRVTGVHSRVGCPMLIVDWSWDGVCLRWIIGAAYGRSDAGRVGSCSFPPSKSCEKSCALFILAILWGGHHRTHSRLGCRCVLQYTCTVDEGTRS